EAGRRMHVDEDGSPGRLGVAVGHREDDALVQAEDVAEVVRELAQKGQLVRAGIPECGGHPVRPEQVVRDLVHGLHGRMPPVIAASLRENDTPGVGKPPRWPEGAHDLARGGLHVGHWAWPREYGDPTAKPRGIMRMGAFAKRLAGGQLDRPEGVIIRLPERRRIVQIRWARRGGTPYATEKSFWPCQYRQVMARQYL